MQLAIRELVAAGELAYVFEHGRTFLAPSFDRPVSVAPRIVLTPPGKKIQPSSEVVVVYISPGISFGGGHHPTTRLALRGVEFALTHGRVTLGGPGSRMLDIGTGSGVLAIAALKLGIEYAIGIDLDPCALAEAKANVWLNGLESRIGISDAPAESITGSFNLIAANLRLPTLLRLAPGLKRWATSDAAVVVSGLSPEEKATLLSVYERQSFRQVWWDEEEEWLGLALRKTD